MLKGCPRASRIKPIKLLIWTSNCPTFDVLVQSEHSFDLVISVLGMKGQQPDNSLYVRNSALNVLGQPGHSLYVVNSALDVLGQPGHSLYVVKTQHSIW